MKKVTLFTVAAMMMCMFVFTSVGFAGNILPRPVIVPVPVPEFDTSDCFPTPYVAYGDRANSGKATVMKFDGNEWETVGTAGFSAGKAWDMNLALCGSTPYVAYTDMGNSDKVTVMKFNGNDWEAVGATSLSARAIWGPRLAFGG